MPLAHNVCDKLWTWCCRGFIRGRVKHVPIPFPTHSCSARHTNTWRKNNVDKNLFQLLAREWKSWRWERTWTNKILHRAHTIPANTCKYHQMCVLDAVLMAFCGNFVTQGGLDLEWCLDASIRCQATHLFYRFEDWISSNLIGLMTIPVGCHQANLHFQGHNQKELGYCGLELEVLIFEASWWRLLQQTVPIAARVSNEDPVCWAVAVPGSPRVESVRCWWFWVNIVFTIETSNLGTSLLNPSGSHQSARPRVSSSACHLIWARPSK